MGTNGSKNDDNEPESKKRKFALEDDLFQEAIADPCFEVQQGNTRHFEIMTISQAQDLRASIIEDCFQTCEIPKCILEVCLRSSNIGWDKNSLCDNLYEEDKEKKLFEKVNIPDLQEGDLKITLEKDEKNCSICWMDKILAQYNCGHSFCTDCWSQHFSSKILDGYFILSCPTLECDKVVPSSSIKPLLSDAATKRYENNQITDFVSTHPDLFWCESGRGCNRIIKVKSRCFSPVSCHCGYEFCGLCGDEWHTPIKCSLLASFTAKLRAESETGNWIIVHTKQCPRCHTNIEKNGGCNHMTCRNHSCGYHFCWICLGDWSKHTGNAYACNKFSENSDKTISEARADLERFLHFCKRYDNHRVSMQFEKRVMGHVSRIVDKYEMPDKAEGDRIRNTMTRAVIILYKAKKCLQYTYAFAFHLKKDSNVEIFELNQRDLEVSSETLSALLEHDLRPDIKPEDLLTLNNAVLERSMYCMNRRKKLIEHVFEGAREGLWKYHPSPVTKNNLAN